MNASHLMSVLILLTIVGLALAALPPMSKQQLRDESSLIVTGKISKVTTSTRSPREGFEDTIFHFEITVASVEKGSAKVGESIAAETSQPSKRPHGWAGPQGQNETPVEGILVRCYLRGSATEGYKAITPNGLEILKPATTQP